jgi:predicted metal-dependent peptidase
MTTLTDEVFLLAWTERKPARIAHLLADALGGPGAATREIKEWASLPLSVEADVPRALPGGLPLDPDGTGCSRWDSPIPGVLLPAAALGALAQDILWSTMTGTTPPANTPRLLTDLAGARIDLALSTRLLRRWAEGEGPTRCLQGPAVRGSVELDDEGIEEFQLAMAMGNEGRPHAFGRLVRAGMTPQDAYSAVQTWQRADGVLPTGQWILEDLGDAPGGARTSLVQLPDGTTLSRALAEELFEVAVHGDRKIQAIKLLRGASGLGLREAKAGVEAIMAGSFVGARGWQPADRPASPSPARAKLDACLDGLLVERPLYWALLVAAVVREDPTCGTMAVGLTEGGNIALFFHPGFVLGLGDDECRGVLVHELNHVLFRHLSDRPDDVAEHAQAWTLACEACANEWVPFPLPGRPITPATLAQPLGWSTVQRYEALKRRADLPDAPDCDAIEGVLSEDPQAHDDVASGHPSVPWALLREAVDMVGDEASEATHAAIESQATGSPHDASMLALFGGRGLSRVPWNRLLKGLVAGLSAPRATRRWPSRRQPDRIGVVPGRRRRRALPVLLAVVDTSASMTPRELSEVSDELAALGRGRVRVAVMHCDTEIRHEEWLPPSGRVRYFHGRGGTDLCPPFAPSVLARYEPSLVVYFTDGLGPAPSEAPPGVGVLWVLTGPRPRVPAGWGRGVAMQRGPR